LEITLSDRIESLKVGLLGACSFTLAYTLLGGLLGQVFPEGSIEGPKRIQLATELLSGFLFAVTYRYVIRDDANSHLKEGAVFAFGLVRGFSPWEMGDNFELLSLFLAQNLVAFLLTRWVVDFALSRSWIKPKSS
jgi:hypothetical protein